MSKVARMVAILARIDNQRILVTALVKSAICASVPGTNFIGRIEFTAVDDLEAHEVQVNRMGILGGVIDAPVLGGIQMPGFR